MLFALVRPLFVSSGESSTAGRTLVRLKSIMSVEVADKVGFAGKDPVAAYSGASMHRMKNFTGLLFAKSAEGR